MEILDQIIFREMVQQALALMTPGELILAAGRATGMTDRELAELFNIEPATVSRRLIRARERIVTHIPELGVTLAGREHRDDRETCAERDAGNVIVDPGATVDEAARRLGVPAETVVLWIQTKKLPGAYKLGKEWWVPTQELEGLEHEQNRNQEVQPAD